MNKQNLASRNQSNIMCQPSEELRQARKLPQEVLLYPRRSVLRPLKVGGTLTWEWKHTQAEFFKVLTALDCKDLTEQLLKVERCSHRNANVISVCLFPLMLLH